MTTDAFPPTSTGVTPPRGDVGQPVPAPTFPPVVYVPCSPLQPGDDRLGVDVRRTRDGRLALLVYSALDRLVSCCGVRQPWTVMPASDLERIRQETGFELVLLDVEIPDEFRRQSGDG